jgi:hypothetical protein
VGSDFNTGNRNVSWLIFGSSSCAALVEAIKYELKKYIKRERNKKRPEEVDFWDFDCRYGANETSCSVIHVSEINKVISEADAEGLDSFFLEVLFFAQLVISLNLVLAGLRLGLKNRQVGEKWVSDDCSYLCKGLLI